MEDRFRQRDRGQWIVAQFHDDCIAAGLRFRRDPRLAAGRQNQHASLGARLLDRSAHERVDQFFKNDLARDGLRHLDHGREIEVFDGRRDRAGWIGWRLFRAQVRIHLFELPHLAVGAPAQETVARLSQINVREIFETARLVEARGQFVGDRLILDEAVGARRADGLFVQTLCVDLAALEASDLRADQRRPILNILGAEGRPCLKLAIVFEHSLEISRTPIGDGVAATGGSRQSRIVMIVYYVRMQCGMPE